MTIMKILVPVGALALAGLAYRSFGWPGVALVVTGMVMWTLLHVTRLMKVLQRASSRPVGYCDSAVMLNAKLRPRVSLLHVLAMTKALGELQTEKDVQPEIYRWTDSTASHVTCEFMDGKLVKWTLYRPPVPDQ
jgi:hypothetical protein